MDTDLEAIDSAVAYLRRFRKHFADVSIAQREEYLTFLTDIRDAIDISNLKALVGLMTQSSIPRIPNSQQSTEQAPHFASDDNI